ncbi:hypothetical protein C8J32_10388 [Rhizobium sp. PP-CC-3A-592]|nr:hypothetical protein C8J32_10388 [Rhizobium sp. PP-CC-3A-592]
MGDALRSGYGDASASLIVVGRPGIAEPILGSTRKLDAIVAAAIGGASLMGDTGSIVSTTLGTMRNGSTLMNVQAFHQGLANGLIVFVAAMIDRATKGRG